MPVWPDGLDEDTGDALVTEYPLQTSGEVWYVSSVSGGDSNAGNDRALPFSTFSAACGVAQYSDIIVLLPDHNEEIDSTVDIPAGVVVVGSGLSGGNPVATFHCAVGSGPALRVADVSVQIRNVKFTTIEAGNAVCVEVANGGNYCTITGCRFEQASSAYGVHVSADVAALRIDGGSTFVSVATSVLARAYYGVFIDTKGPEHLVLNDVVFDAGTAGFLDGYALYAEGAEDMTHFFERVTLLNGADVTIDDGALGVLAEVRPAQGGARVVWQGG